MAYQNSWTLDARVGRSTLGAGLCTLDSARWTLDAGLWTLDSGRWILHAGLWTLDAGLWALNPGRWNLDAGPWTLDTVVDCCRTESESSFWICLIKLLKILWVRISKDHNHACSVETISSDVAIFRNYILTLSVTLY